MFQFATATKIVFGCDAADAVLSHAAQVGIVDSRNIFVVTGANPKRAEKLIQSLQREADDAKDSGATVHVRVFAVDGEPTTEVVDRAANEAREHSADLVVGYGGGSVLDAGKAVAMLVANGGEALDYLEVIGQGKPIEKRSVPYIAVTTTAGTGAEVTKNAVVKSVKHQQKASLRSVYMYPTLAVVDPKLTLSVPPAVTAATGLDAFTQCLEPLVSCMANPLCDAIAARGLAYGARSLRRAYTHGDDLEARTNMSLCSLFGGLALANSKLGAVHGFAGVLGGMLAARHGEICAALLPATIAVNVEVMRARDTNNVALAKYQQAAEIVVGKDATVDDLVTWVAETCKLLRIPTITAMGLKPEQYDAAVAKSSKSSSMKGNPIKLTEAELTDILKRSG
eukprot:TRINITY_DN104525_c0_g1_i1.p1 TRINITY_DN104525_c0_g1~~TRINITY_DN104525_c0_g1_i1.p1  ORF type:complete len:396 (+),score=178.91 TRINITY_DN104525_c0_g1_i1:3-1190(+)